MKVALFVPCFIDAFFPEVLARLASEPSTPVPSAP